MTDQITVPKQTWDAMRGALENITENGKRVNSSQIVVSENVMLAAEAALTAANAVSAPKACDMGVMCLDCQPRGKNGECPDQQPQVQGGAYISVSDLRSMRRGNIGSDNTKPSHSLWLGFNQALDAAIDYALHYPAHPQATEPQAQGEAQEFQNGYDTGYEAGVLHASQATEPAGCTWTQQDDEHMPDTWASSCGELWSFIDGGPKDNRLSYCHHCGGSVKLAAAPEEP